MMMIMMKSNGTTNIEEKKTIASDKDGLGQLVFVPEI
jgi:hypothetical protein